MHKRKMSYLVSYTTLVNLVWCLTSWCENNYKCKAIFLYLLKFLVILNMILGNLIAITQTSIKRMLAYLSISLVLFSFHIEKPWKISSLVTIVHPPFPLFGDALSSWKYAYYDLEGQIWSFMEIYKFCGNCSAALPCCLVTNYKHKFCSS